MKVNNILKLFASAYQNNKSVIESIELLQSYDLLSEEQTIKIIKDYQEDFDIIKILESFKTSKEVSNLISFYHNYYQLSEAINLSLEVVESNKKFKKEITSSLVYPILLIIFTGIALIFITSFILPQILLLNPNTLVNYQVMIMFIQLIPFTLFSLIILTILFYIIFNYLLKKDFFLYSKFLFKLPLIPKILQQYFSILLAFYLREVVKDAKLDIISLQHLENQVNNKHLKCLIQAIMIELEKGSDIFSIFKVSNYFSKDFKQTIYLANNSTSLYQLINDYYQFKITSVQLKIKSILVILIPSIIGLVGVFLILLYLLIMLPILDNATSL